MSRKRSEVCIRTVDGERVCGSPVRDARENPSKMSTLAAMQYRRHSEALREMWRESPADETLEEAQERLLGYTGQYANREASLAFLSNYVRANFTSAEAALQWVTEHDRRLGVWCAAQVARTVAYLAPDGPPEVALRAIEAAEAWCVGKRQCEKRKKPRTPRMMPLTSPRRLAVGFWSLRQQRRT